MNKYIVKNEFIKYNSDATTTKEFHVESIIREEGMGDFNMRDFFTNLNYAFGKAVSWEVDKEHTIDGLSDMEKHNGFFNKKGGWFR